MGHKTKILDTVRRQRRSRSCRPVAQTEEGERERERRRRRTQKMTEHLGP